MSSLALERDDSRSHENSLQLMYRYYSLSSGGQARDHGRNFPDTSVGERANACDAERMSALGVGTKRRGGGGG